MNDHGQPVLYAIVTGSPAARDIGKLVDLAHGDGWDVCVIASPDGYRFIDADTLATTTGHTVRHRYKEPDAPDVLPPADAMVVAPITCNSLANGRRVSPTPFHSAYSWKLSASASPSWLCRSATGHRSASQQSERPCTS
jgi:hypothetical protein